MSELRALLRLQPDGFCHAGDQLVAQVHIKTTVDVVLVVGTIQLTGELLPDEQHVDCKSLEALRQLPGYAAEASSLHGGGSLFEHRTSSAAHHPKYPIYSAPPTILAAGQRLLKGEDYLYEWIVRLPSEMVPSYHGSMAKVLYRLVVGLKLQSGREVVFERTIRILPAFHSPSERKGGLMGKEDPNLLQSPHFVESPLMRYDFAKPINLMHDSSFCERIAPKSERESVLGRYKRGIMPLLADFRRYPMHPLHDRSRSQSQRPTQASMFNVLALESPPAEFALQHENVLVAKARLGRTILRLGEEMDCLMSFEDEQIATFQLQATVECQETVEGSFLKKDGQAFFAQVRRQHESICWMHKQLSFSLSLPSDDNPSFDSTLLSNRWALRIVLACARLPVATDHGGKGEENMDGDKEKDNNRGRILERLPPHSPDEARAFLVQCEISLTVLPCLALHLTTNRTAHLRHDSNTEAIVVSL